MPSSEILWVNRNEFNYSEVYAPLDLKIGSCRISVAAPRILIEEEDPSTWSNVRIATKYPNITQNYYECSFLTQQI